MNIVQCDEFRFEIDPDGWLLVALYCEAAPDLEMRGHVSPADAGALVTAMYEAVHGRPPT